MSEDHILPSQVADSLRKGRTGSAAIEDFAVVRRYMRGAIARACPYWSSDEVEEVTQRAVVRLVELEMRKPQPDGFTPPYLSKVAYTSIVDEFRRRAPEVSLEAHEETRGEFPSREQTPEGDCRLSELRRAIWACLGNLIRNRQHAVALLLMGYKNREIATLTGWDAKQTENHVTRGRADLRSCLEQKGFGRV